MDRVKRKFVLGLLVSCILGIVYVVLESECAARESAGEKAVEVVGDFEEGIGDWYASYGGGCEKPEMSIIPESRVGNQSLKVSYGKSASGGWQCAAVETKGAEKYNKLSLWIKGTVQKANVNIYFTVFIPEGQKYFGIKYNVPDTEWHNIDIDLDNLGGIWGTASSEVFKDYCNKYSCGLYIGSIETTLYIDGVVLSETEESNL